MNETASAVCLHFILWNGMRTKPISFVYVFWNMHAVLFLTIVLYLCFFSFFNTCISNLFVRTFQTTSAEKMYEEKDSFIFPIERERWAKVSYVVNVQRFIYCRYVHNLFACLVYAWIFGGAKIHQAIVR